MYCPNCGKEIPDNSSFCSECGASLPGKGKINHGECKFSYDSLIQAYIWLQRAIVFFGGIGLTIAAFVYEGIREDYVVLMSYEKLDRLMLFGAVCENRIVFLFLTLMIIAAIGAIIVTVYIRKYYTFNKNEISEYMSTDIEIYHWIEIALALIFIWTLV